MFGKTVALFCFQAFLAQVITAQCLNSLNALNSGVGLNLGSNNIGLTPAIGLGNVGRGAANIGAAVSNGGGFTVTSSSPITPSGVSVVSEYLIEGPLNIGGQLPVLGAVAVEGQLPTGGAAGTTYSCGNGNVGIVSENCVGNANVGLANAGLANAGVANAGLANVGLANAGVANIGLANVGLNNGIGLGRAGCNGNGLY